MAVKSKSAVIRTHHGARIVHGTRSAVWGHAGVAAFDVNVVVTPLGIAAVSVSEGQHSFDSVRWEDVLDSVNILIGPRIQRDDGDPAVIAAIGTVAAALHGKAGEIPLDLRLLPHPEFAPALMKTTPGKVVDDAEFADALGVGVDAIRDFGKSNPLTMVVPTHRLRSSLVESALNIEIARSRSQNGDGDDTLLTAEPVEEPVEDIPIPELHLVDDSECPSDVNNLRV